MQARALTSILTLLLAMPIIHAFAQSSPSLPGTKWKVVSINGAPIIAESRVSLEFGANGTVQGNTGVNGFSGSAEIDGPKITFGNMRSTRRAASPELMNQEMQFNRALAASEQVAFSPDGSLILSSSSGAETLRCLPATAE